MSLLWWVIVGLLSGWQIGKRIRGFGYGPLLDVCMGMAGAVVGGFMARSLGFSGFPGLIVSTLGAISGAVIMTGMIGFASGKRRYA